MSNELVLRHGGKVLDDKDLVYGSSDDHKERWGTTNTAHAKMIGVGASKMEILTQIGYLGYDHLVGNSSYPTRYTFSSNDPRYCGEEWIRAYHTGTYSIHEHGKGYEAFHVAALRDHGKFVFSDQPGALSKFIINATTFTEGAEWNQGLTLDATVANIKTAINNAAIGYTAYAIGGTDVVIVKDAAGASSAEVFDKSTMANCTATPAGGTFTGGRAAKGAASGHAADHYFGGIVEVDGAAYLDSTLDIVGNTTSTGYFTSDKYFESTGLGLASGMRFYNGASPSGWISPYTSDGLQLGVGTDANWHFILTTIENFGANHGHSAASLYPMMIEHSQLHPVNASPVEWWSHGHNRSGAYFDIAYGGYTWHTAAQCMRGALVYTGQPSNAETFTLNGTVYTVNGANPQDFPLAGDKDATYAGLVTKINATQGATVRAWQDASLGKVYVEWKTAGAGIVIAWSDTLTNADVDGANLGTEHAGVNSLTLLSLVESGLATFYGNQTVCGGTSILSSATGAVSQNLNRLVTPAADGDVIATTSWKGMNTAASPALVTYGTLATEIQAPTENLYEAISRWSVCDVTATPSEYLRLDGTSTIKSIVASKPIYMNGANVPVNFGITPGTTLASIQYSTLSTKPVQVFGIPDQSMLTVFCQQGDVGTNWLAADLTSPTLEVHGADATDLTKYMRVYHDGTNGYSMSGKGNHYISSGVYALTNNMYANQFTFAGVGGAGGLYNGTYGYCHSLKADDGVFVALYSAGDTINNNYYFSTWANTVTASRQHTSGTASTDPTVWLFATENPADVGGGAVPHDQRHLFFIHDGNDAFLGTGVKTRGDLTITNRLIFAPHTSPIGAITGSAYADDEGLFGMNAAGAGLLNEAASATNPTLVPNRANLTDGIGSSGAGVVSLIAGGACGAELTSTDLDIPTGHVIDFTDTGAAGAAEGYIVVKVNGALKRIPYYAVA